MNITNRVVERSDLAALEFLMSKKPRGSVRIGAGNTVGARTSSIFDDLEKFQARFRNANTKSSKGHSKVYVPLQFWCVDILLNNSISTQIIACSW